MFEFVVFTAALSVYAKPVLDRIDPNKKFAHRLYREATVTFKYAAFVPSPLSLLWLLFTSSAVTFTRPLTRSSAVTFTRPLTRFVFTV
jgi:hypothetical protein